MHWPFDGKDIFYLLLLITAFILNILVWPLYKTCVAPTPIFRLAAQITFFFLVIGRAFFRAPDLPNSLRKLISHSIFFLAPWCLYVSIQGTIWQIINKKETPRCPANDFGGYSIWIFVVLLLFYGVSLTGISILKLIFWWKTRKFRRTLAQLPASVEPERLNELLLGAGNVNNQVGLLPSEIERLEKKDYEPSIETLIEDVCSICHGDFKTGDKMVVLPKCRHSYHDGCVGPWLLKTPLCPLCREDVRNNLREVEDFAQRVQRARDLENPVNPGNE